MNIYMWITCRITDRVSLLFLIIINFFIFIQTQFLWFVKAANLLRSICRTSSLSSRVIKEVQISEVQLILHQGKFF